MRTLHRMIFPAIIVPLAIGVSGCGKPEAKPLGGVSGTVTFDGAPVTEGQVQFFSQELGTGAVATIDSSGAFKIAEPVAPGKYKITVLPPPLPEPQPNVEPEIKEYPNIPEFYRDERTSDLAAEVKEGENTVQIEMKKK